MICWPEHITYWTAADIDRVLRDRGFRKGWLKVENLSPFRIVQALKKGCFGSALSGVSEQAFFDAAQIAFFRQEAGQCWIAGHPSGERNQRALREAGSLS